jgi:hypothetical protein
MPKRIVSLLIVASVSTIEASCHQRSGDERYNSAMLISRSSTQSPIRAPANLRSLDQMLGAYCKLDLGEWQRTYFYNPPKTNDKSTERLLGFVFRKGPYSNLTPGLTWQVVPKVIDIDDRPMIDVYMVYTTLIQMVLILERENAINLRVIKYSGLRLHCCGR